MSNQEMLEIEQAIREAVENAVETFGIAFVRQLSMFPSAQSNQESLPLAA